MPPGSHADAWRPQTPPRAGGTRPALHQPPRLQQQLAPARPAPAARTWAGACRCAPKRKPPALALAAGCLLRLVASAAGQTAQGRGAGLGAEAAPLLPPGSLTPMLQAPGKQLLLPRPQRSPA